METKIFLNLIEYGFQGIVILALGWGVVYLYKDLERQREDHHKRMTELGQRMDDKDEKCRQERTQSQEIVRNALERNTLAVDRLCTIIDQTQKKA